MRLPSHDQLIGSPSIGVRGVAIDRRLLTPPNMPGKKPRVTGAQRGQRLLAAAAAGDVQAISQTATPRASKTTHPLTGCSALQLAVIFERKRAVDALLAIPHVSINHRDHDGRTALHYAAALSGFAGDPTLFYALTGAGARDSLIDGEGFTAHDVRQNPSLVDLGRIRANNAFPLHEKKEDDLFAPWNEEALLEQVMAGEYQVPRNVTVLSPGHADVHKRLFEFQCKMAGAWVAVRDGDVKVLKHLVCDRNVVKCKDSHGRTLLHLAFRAGWKESIDYLVYLHPQAVVAKDKAGRVPSDYVDCVYETHTDSLDSQFSIRPPLSGMGATRRVADDDGFVDPAVLARILAIDTTDRNYESLEQLQMEGYAEQIWRAVKRNVGNEQLVRFVNDFRSIQTRFNAAIDAIDKNDEKKMQQLADGQVMATRDTRGLRLLHLAVLRERHEMVEWLAAKFPQELDGTDSAGRTAVHYAAVQPNAIYDTLVELGANPHIQDKEGFSAEAYRNSPDRLLRPPSAASDQLMAATGDDDDELFDPDAPREEEVEQWVSTGDVARLENLVLSGRSHLLTDKHTLNTASAEFLRGLSQYQSKIDAIHKAVEDGDVRRVKSLIDRPLLATARDSYGMTPLHKALLHGQTNTVRYVLGKFPQCVNATDHAGRTPLHYAAADPNGEHMIKVLQKAGGDAFIEDKHGHTPFYYRTHGQRLNVRSMKDHAVMSQLISGQISRPLLQDLEEDIYDWIHTGNVGKLEELVLNGYADLLLGRNHEVEDVDSIGFLEVLPQYQAKIQAIHKAVETGNLRAVKLLTDRKKLALCRDSRGLSPLHKAIVFEKTDIAKYLIRNYPQSVNAMDQKKRTPLHYAAALRDGGHLYKTMRKSGADPNIYDCNGRPAKYYLKHQGEIDLAAMRLDTKAALKQVLHNRVAPSYLESSIQQWLRDGQLAKLEQLVLSGCGDLLQGRTSSNPDTSTFLDALPEYLDSITAIHKAVKDGELEKLKKLMTSKKLAIARDRYGCTPLHAAVVHEHTDIVRFIAGHFNSVLNAPDYNKRTAMHYAAAARDGGHYLKILGKAGADPMAVDNEGRTPDYYRRNAVIDLKMIKDRDEEFEMITEEMIEDGPLIDSPGTPDSGSASSSAIDSARHFEDDDELDRFRFERMVHSRVDLPTSENGIYLARTVAPVLTKALAEVLLRRPADPIGFISEWLIKYHSELPRRHN